MRTVYTKEFKQQAVELAESMCNVSKAAKQLGISDVNIHAWKRTLEGTQSPKNRTNLEQSEEVRQLRKENAELKKINIILKSAAAFFSQDHLK